MILECRDLSKSFYTKKALNEVSLKLEGGKIYGLLGENGSGKTTWMKIISGLTKPTSGEILFKEHPWFYGDKAEIAYMSTEPFFYSFVDVNGVGQYYKDFSKTEKLCAGCQWKKFGCKVEYTWQIFIWRSCRKNKGRMRKEKERKQNGTFDQI